MTAPAERQLTQAQAEVGLARQRFASTLGALQYRLKPGTIMNSAWDGVRGRSADIADDAIQAVKERPMTASGIIAALFIFLARDPLWSLVSGWFRGGSDADLVTTRIDDSKDSYDLTTQTIDRPVVNEGVNA